jgi:MFS transporter, UMF1 family
LPKDIEGRMPEGAIKRGWEELKKVWALVKTKPNTLRFLISFLFYDAGVQTVLFMASIFASSVLKFATSELIVLILILQLVAAIGAYVFARLSKIRGNKFALLTMLYIWIAICICAYLVDTKLQFYILGGVVGLVMGGIQSLSRSTYAKLLPENLTDTASFFSFMDVMDKIAVVVGTFAFGFVNQLMGDIRYSALALAAFFIIGWLILLPVKIKKD